MPLKRAFAIAQPEVSQLIRELRQLTGLTQEQLAAELGVAYWNYQPLGERAYAALPTGVEANSIAR
jgi:transcriptional regulator with XRE-family HTH domain